MKLVISEKPLKLLGNGGSFAAPFVVVSWAPFDIAPAEVRSFMERQEYAR